MSGPTASPTRYTLIPIVAGTWAMLNSAMMDLIPGERIGLAISSTRTRRIMFKTTMDFCHAGLQSPARKCSREPFQVSRQVMLTSSRDVRDRLDFSRTNKKLALQPQVSGGRRKRTFSRWPDSPELYHSTKSGFPSTCNLSAASSNNPSRL
jgi:hypothetical protein